MNDFYFSGQEQRGRLFANERQGALSPEESADRSMLNRFIAIAIRRYKMILSIVAASLLIGLVLTLFMTPQYTATTTVEIKRENFDIVKVEGVEQDASPADQEFYQTQYSLLQSPTLAENVVHQLKLEDSPTFFEMFKVDQFDEDFENGRLTRGGIASRAERTKMAVKILLSRLDVEPIRMSRLVNVQFTSPDPTFSTQIANTWTRAFIDSTLERRFEATSYARDFLEKRLDELRNRLEESERQAVDYSAREKLVSVPAGAATGENGGTTLERPLVADDLATLNRELAKSTADRIQAQSDMRAAGGNVSESLDNTAISTLRSRRAEAAAEYADMLVKFEPQYPPALALAARIKELDESIAREEGRVRANVSDVLQTRYRAASAREAALQVRVEQLKQGLIDVQGRSIQYNIFQREVDTNRELYNGLLQRYKEIGVAGGVGVNNISIIDAARVPERPSSPSLPLNLALSLLAGMVAAVAATLAREQIDETITDPEMVREKLKMPLLGVIPRTTIADGLPAAIEDRKTQIVEAYLSVQTTLAFATEHGFPRSLIVTSSRPAEGKSTTAVALAASVARTGQRVILVDGDMRSPSIHHLLEIANETGLSNYLSGGAGIDELVRPGFLPGLSVMTAGPLPPNAAELLTGAKIQSLLTELGRSFDSIIVDAPPVMGLADAPLLAHATEGAIFVIESHATKLGAARLAIHRLMSQAQANVFGVVLSKFSKRSGFGMDYEYNYSYAYGSASTHAK